MIIKRIDEDKLKEFKAEAIRRRLTLSQALEEAIDIWLKRCSVRTDVDANNNAYIKMKKKLSKFKGKYVIFAHGKFIGAFNNVEEVGNALRSLRPIPRRAIVLKVGYDRRIKGRLFAHLST